MSIDLRGFDYALEPLRQQRQWKLDALHARLARIQREIQKARDDLAELNRKHQAQNEEVVQSLATLRDPKHYRQCLQWLACSHAQIDAGEMRLNKFHAEYIATSKDLLAHQQKVDVIETHREECIAQFAVDEAGRLATDADRDWLARSAVRSSLDMPSDRLHGTLFSGREA